MKFNSECISMNLSLIGGIHMSKVFVLGANGGVGRYLVQQLKAQNVDFTAGVRKEEQKETLEAQGIQATLIDVESDNVETLASKFDGYDQVVFSVGSGGHTGADKTVAVDLDGAVKAIHASEAAKVDHFVMVSTWDSRREAIEEGGSLQPYVIAKHYADDYLRRSALKATIVHPGILADDPGTGKIEVASQFENPDDIHIPREDVASVLYEVLTQSDIQGKEFQIIGGNQDIHEAIATHK